MINNAVIRATSVAGILCSISVPLVAQPAGWLRDLAQRVGAVRKLSARPEMAIRSIDVDAATDPWQPIMGKPIASTGTPSAVPKALICPAAVDWNGDGLMDCAYLASNSTQIAILVRLGGNKGVELAYREIGQWSLTEELVAAGKRRLVLNVPESTVVVLSAESGTPLAYFFGD